MKFTTAAVSSALCLSTAAAFSSTAFVSRSAVSAVPGAFVAAPHVGGCACAACVGRFSMRLYADEAEEVPAAAEEEVPAAAEAEAPVAAEEEAPVAAEEEAPVAAEAAAEEEVPAAVAALDGIESPEEAHNVERPARQSLSKKSKGKALSEFETGQTVTATVKSLTSYGAFCDFGSTTDGLLHISQLSVDYVSNVADILSVGQEIEVRLTSIDADNSKVGLSLLSEAQESEAQANASAPRQARGGGGQRGGNRRDDSAVLAKLVEKGWDSGQFVEGTVVSTVDFGAFVRVDVSQLNSEVEGEIDGLVHISALSVGRASSVTDLVNVDDKVQIRIKGIADRKVSLSMVSVEDEATKMEQQGGGGGRPQYVNEDWKKDLERLVEEMPKFENKPMVVDLRS